MRWIRGFVENRWTRLVVALVVLGTGLSETVHDLESVGSLVVGAHHGMVVLGLMHLLRTLPEVVEGFDKLEEAEG